MPPLETITLQGLTTAHRVGGTGAPVLLLHGWGASSELVWPLAEKLIQRGYRLHAPDLPGFGHADEPPRAWNVPDYVAFVLAYLDAQQLERVHLFGHSFGGRLSLMLGAEHSARFDKLVLADSAGVRPVQPWHRQARLGLYKGIRAGLVRVGAESTANRLSLWYGRRYGSADYQEVSGVMRATFLKVVNEDMLPYAARVQRPTLLIWGDQDEATPLWMGRKLETTLPDAGLVIHEGAGHYSYLDALDATAHIMDTFFRP